MNLQNFRRPTLETNQRLESTATLLQHVRKGDADARERLCSAYLPMLTKWAHGRLPQGTKSVAETDDLVQVTLMRALNAIEEFTPQREGAFLAFLRRILLNAMRDHVRRSFRRPDGEEFDEEKPGDNPSAVEKMVGIETVADYESALSHLSDQQRETVILRLEFGYSYTEIAQATDQPSADAARMMVRRATKKLAKEMAS